jgi:hypothetical protein
MGSGNPPKVKYIAIEYRIRTLILTSAASHIEINIMCQDDRMKFTGIELEGFEKMLKDAFGGSDFVIGVS